MKKRSVLNVFHSKYEPMDEKASLREENRLVCLFGSSLMLIGSISSFLSLYFILNEKISEIWPGSLSMFAMGLSLQIIFLTLKNEKIKIYLFSVIFSAYLILVSVIYFHYIGPAVWTIFIIVAVISILYEKNHMLVFIALAILIITIRFAYRMEEFHLWGIFYLAQFVTMAILFVLILAVRGIISSRNIKIHEQYESIVKSEEKLHVTLRSVGDGVISVDEKGIIDFLNPVAQKLTGWNQEEAVGESFDTVFNIINEFTREKVKSPIESVMESRHIIELANHTLLIAKDGIEKPIEDTAAPITYEDGNISGVVLVFRDFADKKEKQKQIEYLSYHDQLTGLYNRRFFEEELKRVDTQRNLPLSFVYADVDGLKVINDAFGHESGDQVIQWTADVFRMECCSDAIIARVGGDEFILVLPRTDMGSVEKLMKGIKEKIEQRETRNIITSISFGWDTKNEDSQVTLDVLRNAENLMYQNKISNSANKRNNIIKSIFNSLIAKCPREGAQSVIVGEICEKIGKAYDMDINALKELKTAGELHDIGSIAVDESILNKKGSLSESEWAQIRNHPETGYRLLGATSEFIHIAECVFAHHERWDGTGYPKGLKGESINWNARAIAIADAYTAMTSERPYRAALSKEAAVAEIRNNAGTQFDPDIARVFIEKVLAG